MRSSLRKRWHKGFNSLSTEIKIFLHKQASLQPHCPKTYVNIYDRDCSLGCSLHICSIIIADLQIRWRLPVPTAVGTTYALALASHLQENRNAVLIHPCSDRRESSREKNGHVTE